MSGLTCMAYSLRPTESLVDGLISAIRNHQSTLRVSQQRWCLQRVSLLCNCQTDVIPDRRRVGQFPLTLQTRGGNSGACDLDSVASIRVFVMLIKNSLATKVSGCAAAVVSQCSFKSRLVSPFPRLAWRTPHSDRSSVQHSEREFSTRRTFVALFDCVGSRFLAVPRLGALRD